MALQTQRTAFLFPGQGSQKVGMGRTLAEDYPTAASIFLQADEILGESLSAICWNGPSEELNETVNTQPALLTHSIAVLQTIREIHPDLAPAFTAGHSMGEFSALVASGSLEFDDALRLVRARGEAMQGAGLENPGGMAAVLGLDAEVVAELCEQAAQRTNLTVQVANDNCPGQVVISGADEALEVASALAKENGSRRVIRLAVSIAAHSELMRGAQDRFSQALNNAAFSEAVIPVIGNVGAEPLMSVEQIKEDLRLQLTSRVRWTETIQRMSREGIQTFLELGSGNVLTKLVPRIASEATSLSIESPESLAELTQ
jgi:[acyl-carrier-protein] S-malonyltransferase